MGWNTFIDRLVYHKDKLNPDTYRKGRFFVASMMVFTAMALLGTYFLFNDPRIPTEFLITNLVLTCMLFLVFPIYRKYGKRVFIVNCITALGYTSNFATYEKTGGIFSIDNIWGIIICSWVILVSNKWSGIFWYALTALTLTWFYYADVNGFKNFRADTELWESQYYYFNYLMAVFFIAVIILMHESSKEKYLKDIVEAKAEIEDKKRQLEVKNEDIVSSINYAKKIQQAILPIDETINRSMPLSFILYKPRDIVSGDFYWFHEISRDEYIFVVADCTGHGVPGAFMTVIGSNLLNQIVIENKITQPKQILGELDKRITFTLKQEKRSGEKIHDGMDLSLIRVNKSTKKIVYAGAKRPAFFVNQDYLTELKATKFSLGGIVDSEKVFEEQTLTYNEEDMIYLYSDGYIDQFGGPSNKKFMTRRLKENIEKYRNLPVQDQKNCFGSLFEDWKGANEQTDDVILAGIRF